MLMFVPGKYELYLYDIWLKDCALVESEIVINAPNNYVHNFPHDSI